MIIVYIISIISLFLIFFAMVGYPVLLIFLDKIKKPKNVSKNKDYEPTLTYMIVAHNEEKVIENKLLNAISLDYPASKLQIIVTSDYSTDSTDEIVSNFIASHKENNIILHKALEHKGKTNAQNEAQEISTGEIIVMTDANANMKKDALRELVSCFTSDEIAYVCGRLVYSNDDGATGECEATYWNLDLKMRDIESRIQTITAGNGSIYAVRKSDYVAINPVMCHDSTFPFLFALKKKRAIFNPDAVSYEKAGDNNGDEYKRKVRMNRGILYTFGNTLKSANVFKYRWFSLFYFGHRTCRNLLWLNHIIFAVCSVLMVCFCGFIWQWALLGCNLIGILLGLISIHTSLPGKPLKLVGYYAMTVIAQVVGAWRQATGKSKPVWEKAESTR